MIVAFGDQFKKEYPNYPEDDRKKIYNFVQNVEVNGFIGLEGRNKNSDNVHKDDPQYPTKVAYAQLHMLWHYHIGIIEYDKSKRWGDRTSEYVIHYSLSKPETCRIVDYNLHPPFTLPSETYIAWNQT